MKKPFLISLLCILFNTYAADFPTPYAGTYYPIYNSGVNQYITPTTSMPFDKVSAVFIAFAHVYPDGDTGAKLDYEQTDEPQRLALLVNTAKQVNPNIKFIISLGWGHQDWTYIDEDYKTGTNAFANSVVQFIRSNNLDGFDIDDEGINSSSGSISQANFDAVISNLRSALNQASTIDSKPYYLTITPAHGNAQVDAQNINNFDLINVQSYGRSTPSDFTQFGYPSNKIAVGIDSEGCSPQFPDYHGLAGIFNWTMSADSACGFKYTEQIANDVVIF